MNFGRNIILENEVVRLEPLAPEHFDQLLSISVNYPDLTKYSPFPFGNEEKFKEYFDKALADRKNKVRYPLAIFHKASNRFVGSTSIGFFSPKDGRVEIGWTWITKDLHGSGLNFHCKFLLLSYIFEELNYQRIELRTDGRNIQSQKAIEKIGGQLEGKLRSHTVMADGYRRDTYFYGILQSEWSGIKQHHFKGIMTIEK